MKIISLIYRAILALSAMGLVLGVALYGHAPIGVIIGILVITFIVIIRLGMTGEG